ncbi:hypothetical protein ACMGE5_06200 [Macrococcus equi]|uniref:hypothetical protein n=1 Tax=Macrococcus equi TaxID=3395462 RepID=UPI0039BEBC19
MFKKLVEIQKRKNQEIKDKWNEDRQLIKEKSEIKNSQEQALSMEYFNNPNINPQFTKKKAAKIFKKIAPDEKALVVAEATERFRIGKGKQQSFRNGDRGLLILTDKTIYFIKHTSGVSYQEYSLDKVKGIEAAGITTVEIVFGRIPKYYSVLIGQTAFIQTYSNMFFEQ